MKIKNILLKHKLLEGLFAIWGGRGSTEYLRKQGGSPDAYACLQRGERGSKNAKKMLT